MQQFLHDGVPVSLQRIRTSCLQAIKESGLTYNEIPDTEHHVVRYWNSVGRKMFILIVDISSLEDYREAVYTTPEIPADGWDSLVKDIEGQERGNDPLTIESRLHRIMEVCEDEIDAFSTNYIEQMRRLLAAHGYSDSALLVSDTHDVDQALLDKIIKRPED